MPKIAKAQGRSVEEWIGASPDSVPPPRVKLRVFRRWHGVCHLTGRKITPPADKWDTDHVKRLEDGGENRESNLAPALKEAHARKTAEEREIAARADAMAKSQMGLRDKPKVPLKSRNTFARAAREPKRLDKSKIAAGVPAIARMFSTEAAK